MTGANIALPALSDTAAAESLCDKLRETTGSDPMPLVDASMAETVSTAAVQLLVSAYVTVEKAGGNLLLMSPSAAVKEAFCALGLEDFFTKMAG